MAKKIAKKKAAKAPVKKSAAKRKSAPKRPPAKTGGLRLFRLNVETTDLDRAAAFYEALFTTKVARAPGKRFYLDAGGVALQVVEVGGAPQTAAKALYFATDDLDAVHARASALGALAQDTIHGQPAGAVVVRPWGERSFYAEDPFGNPLSFVEEGTIL